MPSHCRTARNASLSGLGHSPCRYGARFVTDICTRGVSLSFTPLLLRLQLLHACDFCHVSRVVTLLPVDAVNSVQTQKAAPPHLLTMNSATTLMTSQHCRQPNPSHLLTMKSATTLMTSQHYWQPNSPHLLTTNSAPPLMTPQHCRQFNPPHHCRRTTNLLQTQLLLITICICICCYRCAVGWWVHVEGVQGCTCV
jgi:hypothetical protein